MILTKLNHLKLRLQFTGWLQYIPTAVISLLSFLLAGLSALLGSSFLLVLFSVTGAFLLAALMFDLLTVKFHIHPPEPLPKRNDHLDMFDLVRARRSCRSFQGRKLTSADLDELMAYVRLHSEAPSIGKAPVRFEYIAAPLTVWPVVGANEFLVAIAPSAYNRLAIIDIGRSLQKIVIDATRMGLATCWIGPGADQTSIIEQMGDRFDSQMDHIICVCAIGYKSWYKPLFLRLIQRLQRRRLPIDKLFFADRDFNEALDVAKPPFARFGRTFELCQWSPSSFNGQTTRCVAVMSESGALTGNAGEKTPLVERFDFYAATNSRYYAAVALGIWYANWELGCSALGIDGHVELLDMAESRSRDENAVPSAPRYDLSWVSDEIL